MNHSAPIKTMSLRLRAALVISIGTILGLGISLGGSLLTSKEPQQPVAGLSAEQQRLLEEVMLLVSEEYVDTVDSEDLLDKAIRGMVGDLDTHSAYLDTQEYEAIRASTRGRYSGVGLEISASHDQIRVVTPIDDTPAFRAGVQAGDQILEVDGHNIVDDGVSNTVNRLRGKPGTVVNIKVRRDGYDDPLDFDLTRKTISLGSVRSVFLDDGIGYLRISQFLNKTAVDTERAVNDLIDQAQAQDFPTLNGLVIDLRNNPGGTLNSAVAVSDLFLDEGLIVSAKGRTLESQFSRMANRGDIADGIPMVVLINRGSASGSEIVSGALQDHHRATLVGTRTFGKGLVQTVLPLSKGRAVKITTSRYFTPSGDSINEVGVQPDLEVVDSRDVDSRNALPTAGQQDAQLAEGIALILASGTRYSQASQAGL